MLKMKPKIYTSYRSHGKWGDFLAGVIPTIWCFNILVNSTFILKLMEWQNESSIFTVRIRARQWYWVYKFELKNVIDLLTVPKKLGWNKWIIHTGNSLEVSDDYFYALKLRGQNNWMSKYWKNFLRSLKRYKKTNNNFFLNEFFDFDKKKSLKLELEDVAYLNKFEFISPRILNSNFKENENLNFETALFFFKDLSIDNFKNNKLNWLLDNVIFNKFWTKNIKKIQKQKYLNFFNKNFFLEKKNFKNLYYDLTYVLNKTIYEDKEQLINLNTKRMDYGEFSRFTKKRIFEKKPILITKANLNFTNIEKVSNILNISFDTEATIEKKVNTDLFFLTLKQKRYKRKKIIPLRYKYFKDQINEPTKQIKFSDKPFLSSNQILKNIDFEPTAVYRCLKKNKLRSENFSGQLSRRLLRTKKTLVLPAHVNITLISNSYDVIHSWFIPALGIKIDCVPGRATHHTFYCDSVGFYYGQCAEICGRYHHHMPIRLCILPFEHFLIWWQHFGLPKLLFTEPRNRFETDYGMKKFTW